MALPLPTSYAPMEAKLVGTLPTGAHWQYEPKWDGFRCLAFKDGDAVDLRSKAGQPLNRYFPEVVAAVAALEAGRVRARRRDRRPGRSGRCRSTSSCCASIPPQAACASSQRSIRRCSSCSTCSSTSAAAR